MAVPGLHDLTWDSASCVRIVFGSTRIPFTKFTNPKVETKTEKVKRVGEGRPTKRTVGSTEIADVAAEMLLTDYKDQILKAENRHGNTLREFVIVGSVAHPSIAGSYNTMLDSCRIVSREGPEYDASEKALVKKLGISVMQVWEKGDDGLWKCSSFEAALPSSQARALMAF